jgi:c-di-GMP-binding flagellar brake protein YcgR
MNSYEPARSFERTQVSLSASGASAGTLTIVNLSAGGMQVRSSGSLGEALRAGASVTVTIAVEGNAHAMQARVAWVAAGQEGQGDRFGVELVNASDVDRALLEKIRMGQAEPTTVRFAIG